MVMVQEIETAKKFDVKVVPCKIIYDLERIKI